MIDIYQILNFKILDTSWPIMQEYNWVYQPFNAIEAAIWLGYIPRTIIKYGKSAPRSIIALQCISFLLFSLSDVIEISSTSVLLILFKAAVLIALIYGHKAIVSNKVVG
jgi:hypothetical protein